MKRECPRCKKNNSLGVDHHPKVGHVVRCGHYYRTSDRKWVQRYRCRICRKDFSQATFSPAFRQKKRLLNKPIEQGLISLVSQRQMSRNLRCHRTTVARKLRHLAGLARSNNERRLTQIGQGSIGAVQFDELETFEHTKLKPLSVLAVLDKSQREVLGFTISRIPARGRLAKVSVVKYGPRKDERKVDRNYLFEKIKILISDGAVIESDENPHYPAAVKSSFPSSTHRTYKGRRGYYAGHGELKVGGFDPLFVVNHTFAMFRASVSRLIRKTWCTTKKIEALSDHLQVYIQYHNKVVIQRCRQPCGVVGGTPT
jgi:AraC-like DNA-binding protein